MIDGWFDALLKVIERVGFPIAVAGYLLWRLNGKLTAFGQVLTEVSNALRETVVLLKEHDERARDAIRQLERLER